LLSRVCAEENNITENNVNDTYVFNYGCIQVLLNNNAYIVNNNNAYIVKQLMPEEKILAAKIRKLYM